MAKYFLNIKQGGKSDDMEGNITYKYDLESPILFPSTLSGEKEFRQLEIKTSKSQNEFFSSGDTDKWGVIEKYWNLCVPDDNQEFSLLADNDKITLGDVEGKIYSELYHFPLSTLTVKPRAIFTISKQGLNIIIEPFKIQEGVEVDQIELKGEKFASSEHQSLIQNIISNKKELIFNFCPNNDTYFSKTSKGNSEKNNVFVIPENSLQENLLAQNQNNSSSSSNKYFYPLVIGIVFLSSFFLVFFLIRHQKSRKK